MGRVGGYNHLKQLGVGSTIAGQILVGALGGLFYGLTTRGHKRMSPLATLGVFFVLPMLASSALLWPLLGTSYQGWPIRPATLDHPPRVGARLPRFRAHARSRVSFSHRARLADLTISNIRRRSGVAPCFWEASDCSSRAAAPRFCAEALPGCDVSVTTERNTKARESEADYA